LQRIYLLLFNRVVSAITLYRGVSCAQLRPLTAFVTASI